MDPRYAPRYLGTSMPANHHSGSASHTFDSEADPRISVIKISTRMMVS